VRRARVGLVVALLAAAGCGTPQVIYVKVMVAHGTAKLLFTTMVDGMDSKTYIFEVKSEGGLGPTEFGLVVDRPPTDFSVNIDATDFRGCKMSSTPQRVTLPQNAVANDLQFDLSGTYWDCDVPRGDGGGEGGAGGAAGNGGSGGSAGGAAGGGGM